MQEKREISFDAFKGVAITAVVAIHGIYAVGSPYKSEFVYYRQLLNFCVPLFFFIAGYWSSKADIVTLKDYGLFLKGRLSRILIPYFFWSAFLIVYKGFSSGGVNLYHILFKIITGSACPGYYFVIALAQMYVLTPVLQCINRRFGWRGFVVVILIGVAIYFILYLSRFFDVIAHLPLALPFYGWMIYYEMGLFLPGRYSNKINSPAFRFFILAVLPVSVVILLAEMNFILSKANHLDFMVSPIKFSTLLYSICVILGCFSFKDFFERFPKAIYKLGYYSYGIYLIHMMVLTLVTSLVCRIHIISSFQPVLQLVLIVFTLAICMAIINISRKLLPDTICRKVLGF